MQLGELRKNFSLKIKHAAIDFRGRRLLLAIILFAAIYFLLVFSAIPVQVQVELGKPSPQTIYAPREVTDYYTTNQLREEAAQAVPDVYD
ncbi:MAG: hypothetical protein GX767_03910, partial [Firmicutes bacterium]|nr:hypothetical protein [Bacillota bacterium]